MGPILLVDKSAIEALSGSELNFLRRFYSLNIAPVLLLEILADLNKPANDGMSKRAVAILARKLTGCASVNMHHLDLIKSAIYGGKIVMRGVPILGNGRGVVHPDGKKGFIIEESVEEAALVRWRNGEFLAAEEILGKRWRESTRRYDLESVQRLLREAHRGLPSLNSIAELKELVDDLIIKIEPVNLLTWFVNELPLDLLSRIKAAGHFVLSKADSIAAFSAYLHHCVTVALLFRLGLAKGIVGTKATNRIDLQYLFYLPFCGVFSSRDKFQVDLVSCLLMNEQVFLHGDELKADLAKMVIWRGAMSAQERGDEEANGGVGPPEWPDSPTYRIWQTQMSRNYRRSGPRNLLPTLPPELLERVMEHVTGKIQSAEPFSGAVDSDHPDVDFVAKRRTFRFNDPCFCGSDVVFGECCGKGLSFGQPSS